jgi:UPF0716 protein FxsA
VRTVAGLLALAEVVVYVLVASWIGLGATILATLATSALGWALLARQGTRALAELRERARTRQPAGRELGDAGLVAVGGLLMVVPGFLTDLVGLLCLLPGTRGLVRVGLVRMLFARLPDRLRGPVRVQSGPVRVQSSRPAGVGSSGNGTYGGYSGNSAYGATREAPLVIEGEVVRVPEPPGHPSS